MIQLFGLQLNTLMMVLLAIALIIMTGVALLALTNRIFFKIGVRNIPRRRTQMVLIVFALMLSTTLLSSVLATGDVMTSAVQSVAVYNWENIDEIIQGGQGSLGFFDDRIYYQLLRRSRDDSDISAIGASLTETDLLVADETSRQVRSNVTGLGILNGSEQGFGGMQNAANSKQHLSTTLLGPDEVYLNQTAAQLLNASAGDTLYLYSQRWPGQRYVFHVKAIVQNGGLVGESPYIISQIGPFRQIEHRSDDITQIFVENRGGGGVSGITLSDQVTHALQLWIPGYVHVIEVKEQGVQDSQLASDIFSRIFTLFSLFALAIGLLLIFLIFVLLAAERRTEMGMARAIGVQRRHLILMFLFEGTIYDLIASFIGLAAGVGLGALLVLLLGPILATFNFPLKLTFQPHSLIIAYCLGVIFTFVSVALSSWLVSRMTIVEAIRDLPEPQRNTWSLGEICLRILELAGIARPPSARRVRPKTLWQRARRVRRVAFEQIPDVIVRLIGALVRLGFLPLIAGYLVMQDGLEHTEIVPFSLGLTLIVLGGGLLVKATIEYTLYLLHHREAATSAGGIFAALAGLALTAYWALPFDVLANLGLPRFYGGIEIFFIAGMMMVTGTVWALIANGQWLVRPALKLFSGFPGFYAVASLASAYPLHRRFRTGLSVIMFSLVVFAMTVMAVITAAMQNSYVSIENQTGGYDIQAVAYFKPLPDLQTALASHGINPNDFSAIGESTSTAVGIIQLSASNPAWRFYPAEVVSGGFLNGYGLHLVARAKGFSSDNAVWKALQAPNSHYALIDSSALPYLPNSVINAEVYDPNSPLPADAGAPTYPPGFPPGYTYSASGIYQGEKSFPATPIWVATPHPATTTLELPNETNYSSIKLTIIGVVDNSDGSHFGLYIPSSEYGYVGSNPSAPQNATYYFKVAPGQNARDLSLKLGSAFLDYGLETTVLADAIWQVRGPRIFLSDVLLGVVGLTLLLGVAALAITGTRAVVERRQQIGMLRALGCGRRMIQGSFLLESFLVGAVGSVLGVVLGLILSYNIFAANFFEQYATGLTFAIPWQELGLIVGIALLASFLGALLPAWQAGRVAPAEAIRYQ
ncbi:MAG TPA: FtsX-like permease family protein [Ktedonobacteraceae bacterium]|nr:FtsX-like permease family protein [Ktedonobacteraceae bacterium]